MFRKIISHPLFIGAMGGLIANFLYDLLKKYGGLPMDFLYGVFWNRVWPIWIGLAIAIIYWFIRFLLNFQQKYIHYNIFYRETERDLKEKQEAILGAWGKISGHEVKIEQLEKAIMPSLMKKLDSLETDIKNVKDFIHYKNKAEMVIDLCEEASGKANDKK